MEAPGDRRSPFRRESSERWSDMQSNNTGQPLADESTVNVKRTTLASALIIGIGALAAISVLAFYASYKAMDAASKVDEQWQSQHARILNIEAQSVQASSDAALVKLSQAKIDASLLAVNKRVVALKQAVEQANSYESVKSAMEAENQAALRRITEEKAAAAKLAEAAELKGVDNFDTMLTGRLRQHWTKPESTPAGGATEILVQFAADGTVTNALVTKSCGVKDVDDSVIQAAANLARIPEMSSISPAIYRKYLQQRPIKFSLQ